MSTLTLSPHTFRPASARPARSVAVGPAVRLTRRGRLALTAVVGLGLLAGTVATGTVSVAGDRGAAPVTHQVVVQPGQTLWQLATKAMPGTDPREAVVRLRELNRLSTTSVQPGQQLLVPGA